MATSGPGSHTISWLAKDTPGKLPIALAATVREWYVGWVEKPVDLADTTTRWYPVFMKLRAPQALRGLTVEVPDGPPPGGVPPLNRR
jgi:hypothetical protein